MVFIWPLIVHVAVMDYIHKTYAFLQLGLETVTLPWRVHGKHGLRIDCKEGMETLLANMISGS